ncbi:hypothetical protein D6D12_06313 [Aureobasidium pullulans]|uniref:Uncharacterized protein n=1 Tax=Aureobasidium pullulans TaxID=5580 RepID=A0AB74JPR6_AURPU|nr:hypothetical protein D6D12_06313 [Aureobasidium pullulans]THX33868.1 hypothetical protein D6D11_09722 [Aureobasidium pullulans]
MPAPLAKGILISLSILAAVGIAVYENPQVKEWVEDQRRKITEFLRTFGDSLDPQTRREAEAFAYEGRLPNQTREEAAGTANAVARATGRETADDSISRRNRTSHGPQSPDEAEERRRLGREYLAKRNQEMLDLKERQKMRRSTSDLSEKTPPSPTFDQLVNVDGSLKMNEKDSQDSQQEEEEFNEKTLDLPSVPTDEPKSLRSIPIQEAVMETAFNTGSRYANPFGDEFELSGTLDSRSPTPKPPVPPKIAIEDTNSVRKLSVTQKEPSIRQIPVSDPEESVPDNLSYEEQLVRAMSISLAESEEAARQARALEQEQREMDFAAAVAASLADVEKMRQKEQESEQLVNLTPDPPISVPTSEFDADELYTLSPNLATRRAVPAPFPSHMVIPPYDPVHEAAEASVTSPQQHSQTPLPQHTPTTATFSSPEIERDAISFSSASSTTDDFASAPASVAASEMSLIDFAEVESVDSGDESEPEGVLTPGSWTDVGSDVGSEDQEGHRLA